MNLLEITDKSESGVIRNIWMYNDQKLHILNKYKNINIVPVPNSIVLNNAKCFNIFGENHKLASILAHVPFVSCSKIFRLDEPEDREIRLNVAMKSQLFLKDKNFEIGLKNNILLNNVLDDNNYEIGWIRLDEASNSKVVFSHFSTKSSKTIWTYIVSAFMFYK